MKISFSWSALIIIMLVMIPNIIYFIMPSTDITESLGSRIKLIESIENISRIISFILLLFLSKNQNPNLKSPLVVTMFIFLALYFILWGRYFYEGSSYGTLGKSFLGIPAPMVIFPVCYFICAAFWLDCFPAVITLIVFGVFHAISVM
ncbi:hypothetical protein [Clostridium sp. JS66]|uniref:hypothetical protein n=1 Tax=Clostridium sp. JS66 TaxID=3064705 RepID=UPI00298E0B6D|nr:hypothetical protein [Clostridium sp. JS66]WPC42704.1 hypothetical protein Q6H37_04320 [Clostridium sp. JS66]